MDSTAGSISNASPIGSVARKRAVLSMSANASTAHQLSTALPGDGFVGEEIDDSAATPAPNRDLDQAVNRDRQDYAGAKPALFDYLRHAREKSGRRPMELVREFFKLSRGRGKLTFQEYVQYGVYDRNVCDTDEQLKFISNLLHWPITHTCCDMTWQATTEDKWLCSHILDRSGIRVPETLAVIDKSERAYPGTLKISTAEQFRDFAKSNGVLPFFGKENRGICSFGAFVVEEADDDFVYLKGHGAVRYEVFIDVFVGGASYLLQEMKTNHGFFSRYTDGLATVRVCVLLGKSGIHVPFAVLKLPSRGNIADNFWRPGNLACNLDPRTGAILGVRSKDALGTTEHELHPETGKALLGESVPMWDRVLELVQTCAPVFQPVRYQSMDIAVSAAGPVVIEVNTGGGFDLPQLASGKGFLTDEVTGFFRDCGYLKV